MTVNKRAGAVQDEKKYEDQKQIITEEIKEVLKKLKSAENAVDRAAGEVEWLRYAPVVPEPSVFEDIEKVRRVIPQTTAPIRGKVLLSHSLRLLISQRQIGASLSVSRMHSWASPPRTGLRTKQTAKPTTQRPDDYRMLRLNKQENSESGS